MDTAIQYIHFDAKGAQNVYCDVYIDKLRYQVYPPQKINVTKSSSDMIVKCMASGNRDLEIVVKSKFSGKSLWGGPPGMAIDYASNSLHYYPEHIMIDFTGFEPEPFALPSYNDPDLKQPESYEMEEINPGFPSLNSDKDKIVTPLKKREAEPFSDPATEKSVSTPPPQTEFSPLSKTPSPEISAEPENIGASEDTESEGAPQTIVPEYNDGKLISIIDDLQPD